MQKPIIFIFGPSGVGKSYTFDLMKKQGYLLKQIDTDKKERTFTAYGFPSEWDNDFTKVNFDFFAIALNKELNRIEHTGIIISFPTDYRFSIDKLNSLRDLGIIPILLWGTEKNCKQAAEARINKKGYPFDLNRYDLKNKQTFQLYSHSGYDIYRIETFRVDGSRISDEELELKISNYHPKVD